MSHLECGGKASAFKSGGLAAALHIALLILACSREPVAPATKPTARVDTTPEDPPYAIDSVFKPETHRGADAPLPGNVQLLRDALVAKDGQAYAHLGEAVAIDGNVAVAGAPYAEAGSKTDAGAAYVFERVNKQWLTRTKLVAPNAMPYDRFGSSVAVDGNTIVVTADRCDKFGYNAGAAFVFARDGDAWRHAATIAPPSPQSSAAFGYSSALDGDTLVIGAPGVATAHVFARRGSAWVAQSALHPDEKLPNCGFGHSVAVDGDTILVGANTTSDRLLLGGSAYVFRRNDNAWTFETSLRSSRDEATARFGTAVAIRGDVALIGASRATVNGRTRAGAAFVFERRGNWKPIAELTNDPPRSDEEFGRALALLPDAAVVGSQFGDAAGLNTGGAQLYARDGGKWTRRAALLAQDRATISEFAFAIAASDTEAIIGAPRRNTSVTASGGAYIFEVKQ